MRAGPSYHRGPGPRTRRRSARSRSHSDRGAISLSFGWILAAVAVAGASVGAVAHRTVLDDGPAPVEAAVSPGGSRAAVAVFECPGEPASDLLHSGDRIFVTGVHEDDDRWLRIRHPLEPDRVLWIEAAAVAADGRTEELAPARCDVGEWALAPADDEEAPDEDDDDAEQDEQGEEGEEDEEDAPGPGGTDGGLAAPPGAGPGPAPGTPGPGAPRPGPATTAAPRPGGGGTTPPTTPPGGGGGGTTSTTALPAAPAIGTVTRSHAQFTEQDGAGLSCPPGTGRSSLVTAAVSAPAGAQAVELRYSFANRHGGTEQVTKQMSHVGGGSYQAAVGPVVAETVPFPPSAPTPVTWSVRVVDSHDRVATFNAGPGHSIHIRSIWECFG